MNLDLNAIFDLFLLFEISDLLNIFLIIITLATVRYASKTLIMEYSSQIIISRYRLNCKKKDSTYSWEVNIENKGKGYVVKAFILLSIKSTKRRMFKQYHLSQPLLDIEPGEKDVIKLLLKENELVASNAFDGAINLEVCYQDALNHIYVVSPAADQTNKHLE